jgi:hypothetical protein|nr:MAG TPA: hypothetical protein [Caudoviricetes sp.]
MATANNNIKNSWSLLAFAKEFGPKMSVGDFANQETGEMFKSCIFDNHGTLTFVAFSSKLGVLSPKEIAAQKNELQVVLCETKKGKDMYSLCKQGENTWEEVDLGL